MIRRDHISARTGGGRIGRVASLLLALALSLGAASAAHAINCSDLTNGVLDGFAGDIPPSQLQIDRNCTIRNYPASNPLDTNFSFYQPSSNPGPWLVIFDNVVHTGQMACNAVADHKIWFTNGSSTSIQEGCQNLLIPVEKIDKQNPTGQTTAAIGVPFTYTLTIPVLFDPATGTVINNAGSVNDLHSIILTDDLNATGVDLTYVSHTVTWRGSGAAVPHAFSNVGGVLTFDIGPIIPAGQQIEIAITVVLEDTPTNSPGTQFINTAKWEFGRLIDDVFYEPLPGEWGISPPLTIAAPELVMTKTGPATLGLTLNLGQWGQFGLDVENTGLTDAWDVTLLDQLPNDATGGMCDTTPEILSAEILESGGGTRALVQGSDYTLAYAGAPTCELTLSLLTAAGPIGPGERLVVSYRARLDADTQDGAMLTNVAGATRWFNDQSGNPDRVTFIRSLTDGTPGVTDHEDAHTVTAALFGYFFEKSVADLNSGANPAATATPGDTLRYTLRVQATDVALTGLTIRDDLGALNTSPVFVPGSLSLVSIPGGATDNSLPGGGTSGAGLLEIANLDVPAGSQVQIVFDIQLDPGLADGTLVLNQADLLSSGVDIADSDDPNVNGQADPSVPGDEDPTQVLVEANPPEALLKANTQATATIGEEFSYLVTLPSTAHTAPLYDVRILDDLTTSAADLEFVSVAKVSGPGSWTPVNTGSSTNLVIEDTTVGIDIPAGEQIVLEITVRLSDTATNVAGLAFTNTADYTYNLLDGEDPSQRPGGPGTTAAMTIVEPELTLEKDGPALMTLGTPGSFRLDVHNAGDSPAWTPTITDRLPDGATGGTCDTAPANVTVQLFESNGSTPVSGVLVEGTDYSLTWSGTLGCLLTIGVLSDQGTIGPDQRLIVTYDALLDGDTQQGAALINVAGAVEWFGQNDTAPVRRTYSELVTDGTPSLLDHQDAHTVAVALPGYLFEKTVMNETTGVGPATTATPGDVLLYRLVLTNTSDEDLDELAIVDELDSLNAPPAFQAGTLQLVSAPGSAITGGTNANGGAQGTGLLDVRGLTLPAMSSLTVEFRITLAPVLANGSLVANQSQLLLRDALFALSDDPNVNGQADPFVPDDEDPTQLVIQSAPAFQVQKISDDLTGDPNVLLAGETLRYTITVKNVGTADASDALLRDDVPLNTSYVPGSTTLNGAPVADGAGGTSPLAAGIPINAPEDPTPGAMRADASATPDNVATLGFDVVIDVGAADGTLIANQGFVSAPSGNVLDTPSDDPGTPVLNDPTRDVVGSVPLLFATKSVTLLTDNDPQGVVNPLDVLHYTIEIFNTGAVAATGVVVTDGLPANTSYVQDSTTLNGLPVGVPDNGNPPLASGIPTSSSDLPPPGPGGGTISVGESARIEFDLQVNANVADGTIISNQALVTGADTPNLPTDGDGDPATGPEPTLVVVGGGPQLGITKQVAVVGGGPALAGATVEYLVNVVNIGVAPASSVVITDDVPPGLSYVDPSATMNGSSLGVSFAGTTLTADYSGIYGDLPAGASVQLRFRAVIDPNPIGTTITNTGVVGWNTTETAEASVSFDVGGIPGVGVLSGRLWHDADFDDVYVNGDTALEGWTVELLRNGSPLLTTVSAADGSYSITGVPPNDASGDALELRFRAPDAGPNSASLGMADSVFTNGPQQISDIMVSGGDVLQDLNLPIDPNGVVYGALQRTPIVGATLSLLDAAALTALPSSCFEDPLQQGQVTRGDGFYKFDLNFTPGCSVSSYLIAITPPGASFVTGYSQIIPPTSDDTTVPLDVPSCPGTANDALGSPAGFCEAQAYPRIPVAPEPTTYHVHLSLGGANVPGSSQIFNNHIPLDPVLDGAVAITKTTPLVNVNRGQLVPYEITVRNAFGADLDAVSIVDRFPAGFHYVEGSAQIDGVRAEPSMVGPDLVWSDLVLPAAGQRRLQLLLAVGAGVSEGEFANRAQAMRNGTALSGQAIAVVRVVPDPTFDCTDVLGKVFDDVDNDGIQDRGERGLPGVRLATARGLIATTDAYGRFHITCAIVPRDGRGSNFVLKLDDRSLPSGYRMSTRQTQVKRATRGKALRFSFGASIHRVVGLDLADAVFEPGSADMRPQWEPRLDLLLEQLRKAPAILRLSYIADVEGEELVGRRLAEIKRRIAQAWQDRDGYELTIETEIFWRRGAPVEAAPGLPAADDDGNEPPVSSGPPLPSVDAGPPPAEASAGASIERQFPGDQSFMQWVQDPELLAREASDRLEERDVLADAVETVKLKDVVPPVRFESGVAQIPPSYIEKLRGVLEGMRHLQNVRLHLVGHADDQPLSNALSGIYGDNAGLSRERAGEVAEFLQMALSLPPEAISFEWAGDSQPVASNATPEGRALNRRVEVEVWYDEVGQQIAREEVLIPADIKRVKVCRMETVCKLRYREGNARRARIKNLIAPLRYDEDSVGVPPDFVRQVERALRNLGDKQNVTVKLIGYTDDAPLTGRAERIYGTRLSLSKARAQRVARAVQEALALPSSAVASDGRGETRPVASNATEQGRSLNRRIEVEFWYDDPLQELPDEPQPCPDPAGAERVTKVYDPPWGRIEPIPIDDGEPHIPSGYADELRRAMADVAERDHVRLRFVGYTRNQRLERRTALVYGDDIGLSAARARRAMQALQTELGLSDDQVEHEGRGYVQSEDVVNGGFIQGDASYVAVQVVYDELAVLDDFEGVDVTPITRELRPKDPLALNLMRITVDGEPLDDPGRSSADIQRCTDVALERADLSFRFDELESTPRLSVTSRPTVSIGAPGAEGNGAVVDFRAYTNYAHFIERSEVRIFERGQSTQAEPLAVVPVGRDGFAHWQPELERVSAPAKELIFVLRAYDEQGRFDETAPQSLWLVGGSSAPQDDSLLAGYGESEVAVRGISLGSAGAVEVHGRGIPPDHTVWFAGTPVPVDAQGNFVAQAILPVGEHTVEVAVLDPEGSGELFLRDLELERSDWFYVGIADVTLSLNESTGNIDDLQGRDSPYQYDSFADGRLAFYLTGEFAEDWKLTASADTREGPIQDLFQDFVDKTPEALFRRIDPDYHYPTFGDDSSVEETAPTSGKFYAKLSQHENHLMWGNFDVGYLDNELAHVDRGLYGANAHYQSQATTRFGEQRLLLDGFLAEPGTLPSREEFRGTGGSLYWLGHQDLLIGSERVRIEVRDKDSGLVTSVVHLRPELDYDIDYLQGRVLLSEPIGSTVADQLLVRSQGLSGNEAWLVVQYEFTPGFTDLNALATGGQGEYWINDFLKLGVTANHNDERNTDSSLYAGDLTARLSTESWVKLQAGRSKGLVSTSRYSNDGGFSFDSLSGPFALPSNREADAVRADVSLGIGDFLQGVRGRLNVYAQQLEAGYSAPGMNALTDTDYLGGSLELPITQQVELKAKADQADQDHGLKTRTAEVDVEVQLTDYWSLAAGVRNDKRDDDSPIVPVTQDQGERTDAVVQAEFDSHSSWRSYVFGQTTVAKSGGRDANDRAGVGGAYRASERLMLDGEVSEGTHGPAARLGTNYQQTEETNLYLNYAMENERAYDGLYARRGSNLITGARTRLSDSSSVYLENRLQYTGSSTGLTRTMGVSLVPAERWSLGGNWESGTLIDRQTSAETDRVSGGAHVGYAFDDLQLSSGIEYRYDDTQQPDGTWSNRRTWLFRNSFKYQMTPSGRLLGKFNHSESDSSLGDFFDGGYTEGVLGYAFRPVEHDRLDALAKYTYLYNVPTTDQLTGQGTSALFIQKSHVASIDVTYDLTPSWSVGGKYAYRLGQVSLDRVNPHFFDNNAHLFILRNDYRFLKDWEGSLEGRMLHLPDLDERRSGALVTLYRYFGEHFKVGVGYNFTDFSDDLTDLDYDDHGVFLNMVGTL